MKGHTVTSTASGFCAEKHTEHNTARVLPMVAFGVWRTEEEGGPAREVVNDAQSLVAA